MKKPANLFEQLTDASRKCVGLLVGVDAEGASFRNYLRETPSLADSFTVGDAARAYLSSRTKALEIAPTQAFYAYDADGDGMVDEHGEPDCAELGSFDAANMDAAIIEARRIWPGVANIRVA